MHLFIESEGDIDMGVNHCVGLSKFKGKKFVTLAFPSEFLYKIFMCDLVNRFESDSSLPKTVDIDANIIFPFKDDDDG
tara:strand:- start:694 stop:927 length:234 start_codon:yes stop_codon:yes gene_type:complete